MIVWTCVRRSRIILIDNWQFSGHDAVDPNLTFISQSRWRDGCKRTFAQVCEMEGREVYSFVTGKMMGRKGWEERKDRHYRCSRAHTHTHAYTRARARMCSECVRMLFPSLFRARADAKREGRGERRGEVVSSGTEDAYNRQWTTRPLSRGLTWTPVRRNRSTSRLIIIASCRILSQTYAPPLLRARVHIYYTVA